MSELTLAQIQEYHGGPGRRYGKYIRFKCCLHGGKNPINFQYNPDTGHYKCFKCGEYGYIKDRTQEQHRWERRPQSKPEPVTIPPIDSTLQAWLTKAQAALPGSPGEVYLRQRGIPLELAQKHGIGYAVDKRGVSRVLFPHTRPDGVTVNVYGRALDDSKSPKHKHNAGRKGIFNAPALAADTVFLCEGVFDALSLIAAGHENTVAIFGNTGLSDKWEWVQARRLIFAFDNDQGGEKWKRLAFEAYNRSKKVYYLEAVVFGAHKDLNEVWTATGKLDVKLPELEPEFPAPEPEFPAPEPGLCEAASAALTIPGQAPAELTDDPELDPPAWAPSTYLEALEVRIKTLEKKMIDQGGEKSLVTEAYNEVIAESLGALYAEKAEARAEGRDYYKEPDSLYPLNPWNKFIYSKFYKTEFNYVKVSPDGSSKLE